VTLAVVKFMTLQLVAYAAILRGQGILTEFPWGSILGEHFR